MLNGTLDSIITIQFYVCRAFNRANKKVREKGIIHVLFGAF